MDIALSTTIIVLGVIPGIVFWNSYFSGRFPKQIFGVSAVSELAQYIIFALPIDALALRVFGSDPRTLDLETVMKILTANVSADSASFAASLKSTWWFSVRAYIILVATSWLTGVVLRRFVWACRLDVRIPLLRMKHNWYYILQGRLPGLPRELFPYADILVDHPEGSRLFRGLIWAFEPTGSGEIKELVLEDTKRGKGRGTEFQWLQIPGDRFILPGPRIHSINMRYVLVAPPKKKLDRALYELKTFARSFLFHEP